MRRLALFLALAAVLALQAPSAKAGAMPSYQQLTVSSSSVGITAATYGPAPDGTPRTRCLAVLEAAQIRWRADGLAPTSSVGTPFEVGASMDIPLSAFASIRFIRTTSTDGVLNITCE